MSGYPLLAEQAARPRGRPRNIFTGGPGPPSGNGTLADHINLGISLPPARSSGSLAQLSDENGRRAEIVHRGNVVVLSLFRDGDRETWIITGFQDRRFRTDKGRTKIGRAQRKKVDK